MYTATKIGDLFGKNVFQNVLKADPKVRVATQEETKETEEAKRKVYKEMVSELLENYPLKAVYPSIPNQCMRATMDKYREFVHQHNQKIALQNAEIQTFNEKVDDFMANNQLDIVQTTYSEMFQKKYGKIKKYVSYNEQTKQDEIEVRYEFNLHSNKAIREYNERVEDFSDRVFVLKKKELQPIKATTERVFQQILFCYTMQMYQLNKQYIKLGITHERSLPKVDLHPEEIKHLNKENGIKMLDLSSRTIKRHIDRLLEAGILQNYLFLGTNRPPKTHINPEILVYFDERGSKLKTIDNQTLNQKKGTKCLHSKENTRTNKKNKKEANSEPLVGTCLSGVATALPTQPVSDFFTGTPQGNASSEPTFATPPLRPDILRWKAPKEPQTRRERLSEYLQNQILHPQELAEGLANGDFDKYKPIDLQLLKEEAMYGFLTAAEFRELFFNDFFKSSAKLFRDKEVFVGCWYNAIVGLLYSKSFTVNGYAYRKDMLTDYIPQYRWRLEYARKWFAKHTEIKILFPSDYFDRNRKTSREVGFKYTSKAWKNRLKAQEKAQKRNAEKSSEAVKRQRKSSAVRLIGYKINAFLKEKITYEELYDYVKYNHPAFLEKLPDYVKKTQN